MSGFENPYYGNGGAAGGGGGGYMTQASQFASGGSPGGSGRKAASHSIRPVTLKQLINATQAHSDAEWTIDDVEVGQVTVVAHVISVQAQTTNCVYLLDDGTARMEARQWVDATEDDGKKDGLRENVYVRVLGSLKVFGNKRYITATHIRPVSSFDEVLFHTTEACMVTMIFERGAPPRPSQGNSAQPRTNGAGGHSAYTAQSNGGGGAQQFAHLPPVQAQIMGFLQEQPASHEGVHVAAIARHVGGGDAQAISVAIDALMDQGHIYTTIDESHFKIST